jgi:hemicentin
MSITEPPKIISDIAGTIDVVLGLMLEIPCKAIGTPKPTIGWKKDGFEVCIHTHTTFSTCTIFLILTDSLTKIDADGTLRIDRSELSNAGQYTCTARNAAGNDTRTNRVVVQEPPVILPTTPTEYSEV